jgi:hypothetical protein
MVRRETENSMKDDLNKVKLEHQKLIKNLKTQFESLLADKNSDFEHYRKEMEDFV